MNKPTKNHGVLLVQPSAINPIATANIVIHTKKSLESKTGSLMRVHHGDDLNFGIGSHNAPSHLPRRLVYQKWVRHTLAVASPAGKPQCPGYGAHLHHGPAISESPASADYQAEYG